MVAGAMKNEIGRLIDQTVELASEFKTAFAKGTIEEKRLFLCISVSESKQF